MVVRIERYAALRCMRGVRVERDISNSRVIADQESPLGQIAIENIVELPANRKPPVRAALRD